MAEITELVTARDFALRSEKEFTPFLHRSVPVYGSDKKEDEETIAFQRSDGLRI